MRWSWRSRLYSTTVIRFPSSTTRSERYNSPDCQRSPARASRIAAIPRPRAGRVPCQHFHDLVFDRFGVWIGAGTCASLLEGLAGILFGCPVSCPPFAGKPDSGARTCRGVLGKRKFFQRISEDAQTRQPVHGTPAFVALSCRDAFRFDQCEKLFGNALPSRIVLGSSLFGGRARRTCLKRFFSHGKRRSTFRPLRAPMHCGWRTFPSEGAAPLPPASTPHKAGAALHGRCPQWPCSA